MERIFQLVVVLLVMVSCTSENKFRIEGQLADSSFDEEWVYLVPLVNAPVERVDSTQVKNGVFTFEGEVLSTEVYVIRTRPFIRLSLQELLVVKESGSIYVYLGQNSKTRGTALNDSLQTWKQQKELFGVKANMLQQQYKAAGQVNRERIKRQQKELAAQTAAYNFNFAKNNKNNVVGEMVIRFTKASFLPEQKEELGIE